MKLESNENDALWRALGEATRPAVSPFFARNVLRATRQSAGRSAFLPDFLLRWIGALAFSCVTVGFFVSLAYCPQQIRNNDETQHQQHISRHTHPPDCASAVRCRPATAWGSASQEPAGQPPCAEPEKLRAALKRTTFSKAPGIWKERAARGPGSRMTLRQRSRIGLPQPTPFLRQ